MSSVTTVAASTLQLSKVSDNPMADVVLGAVIGEKPIITEMLNSTLGGWGLKMNNVYRYARDYYTLGLPQGSSGGLRTVSDLTIIPIIQESEAITNDLLIDYNFVVMMTPVLSIVPYLTVQRGYDFSTKLISIYVPGMTDIKDFDRAFVDGVSPNPDGINLDITYIAVSFVWSYSYSQILQRNIWTKQEVETYFYETVAPTPGLRMNYPTYMVKYALLDAAGALIPGDHWWYYDPQTGIYPQLALYTSSDVSDTFLPVVPLRYNNVDLTAGASADTELYATSKKMMKKLKVDIDEVAAKINESPSIADIDNAYLMFGINLQTKNNASIVYLTEFFDYLCDISTINQYDYLTQLSSGIGPDVNSYSFLPPDPEAAATKYVDPVWGTSITSPSESVSLIEKGLLVNIYYNYIRSHLVTGSIGKVGTATKTISSYTLTLRLQVTPNRYKQVEVFGLVHVNMIYRNRIAVYTRISDVAADPAENNFIIPIRYNTALSLPIRTRTELYNDSLQLVLTSWDKTKLKWYETGAFKAVLMVIAIVIAIWTGQAWVAGLVAVMGTGAVAVLMYVLQAVLTGLIISYAFKFIADLLGPEWAMVIGLVAAIVTIAWNPTGAINMAGYSVPTAQVCLTASNALISASSDITTEETKEVYDEMGELKLLQDEQAEELEKATELLERKHDFNPLAFARPPQFKTVSNEHPTAFYNRTIHAGNIGVTVLSVIENYYNMLLKLPELKYSDVQNKLT